MIAKLGQVRMVVLSDVKPYPGNPRRAPQKAVDQCAASIREFGWQQPLIVDRDMVLVAGHTRYAAAKQLGEQEVPVVVAEHLSPEQARAFRIADNRVRDYTTWDYAQLIGELEGLDEDFAAVLDLADWKDIIRQFDDAQKEAELNLDPGTAGQLKTGPHLTVTFDSRESAEKAGAAILDMPGVLSVAYAGK